MLDTALHPLQIGSGGTLHEYDCVIQSEDGQIHQVKYSAPWNPEKDFITLESIARSCAAQMFVSNGKKMRYSGISAELLAA
jgi:hypothetical protein